MIGGWIYEQNLRGFMEAMAHFGGRAFTDDEWVGLEYALLQAAGDSERSLDWPVASTPGSEQHVTLTHEPGSSVVGVELRADHDTELRADALVYLLQCGTWHADG